MSSLNPNCRDCDLWKTAGTVCVAGDGPKNAQVIIVGEAPGASEARTGKPFMGESGQILRTELARNKLVDKAYITNVVKCRPPNNDTPTNAQIKACRKYLDAEIAEIKPKMVMTLGATATKAMFRGKAKITQVHGELIEDPKLPFKGMPAFHPAYALRDPSKLPAFQNDIARLSRALQGKMRRATVVWNVVRRGNIEVFLREFMEAKRFGFDLETSGLFPFDPNGSIRCVGIALPTRTWVIPGYMPKSPWAHGDAFRRLIRLVISIAYRTKKKASAQNGKFDNEWLENQVGAKFKLHFDVMLASHTLDENREHGLKELVRSILDEPEYDVKTKDKQGVSKEVLHKPTILYKYCAFDAAYTLRMWPIFHAELKRNSQLYRLFYRLVMRAARAMEEIEMEGITLDRVKMEEVGLDLLAEMKQLEVKLTELAGKTINWNSHPQMAELFFTDLGLESTVETDGGNPSTSEEALLDLWDQHPIVPVLMKYREVAKNLSTYIRGLDEFTRGDQLHVSFKIHGTVTGRYSSRLHSIPRDGKIRNLATAPPDWRFVQIDIKQAELCVVASLSQDPEMLRCFTQGIDMHWRTFMSLLAMGHMGGEYVKRLKQTVHELHPPGEYSISEMADILLGIGHKRATTVWDGWKEGRKRAKAVNFGYIYGMYPEKFIFTAKTKYDWEPTLRQATAIREGYFEVYPGLLPWHDKQKRLCRLDGFVRMMSGRIRRLPGIHSKERGVRAEAERQAINAPVQGFIGDYKAMVLVEIHETVNRDLFRVTGEHHDAVLGKVRIGYEDKVMSQILSIVRHPQLLDELKVNLLVPLDGEIEIGPWGRGIPYVEKSIFKPKTSG